MGPLAGLRVVEIAGIGPGPFCAMVLADQGAEVVRVDRADRAGGAGEPPRDVLNRGRRSIGVDLKHPDGPSTVLRLVERSDVLIEGFRPGVAERLGIGPEPCLDVNPRLVYGRMTGWGQDGPLAQAAGHDINYVALSGTLHALGRAGQPPTPPLNLVGDFGGGGLLLAFGIMCALWERQTSGRGQVVDAAMVDGSALLATAIYGLRAMGLWQDRRGGNLLDTGAPFYDVYETADGEWVAIGSLEPQFYAELLARTGLSEDELPAQLDVSGWPVLRERFRTLFRTRTREEWSALLEGTDVCFAPVLSMAEAPRHPHVAARRTFVDVNGIVQPAPAPRFERTPTGSPDPPSHPGQHTDEILAELGYDPEEIARLRAAGAVR